MNAALPCEREEQAPRLALLRKTARARSKPRRREPVVGGPVLRLLHNSHVLIAGADSLQRASLLDELSRSMPSDTPFTEASAISEVLERAPGSRMVVLSGDLDDASAETLVHLLGHRHPRLPIVSIDAPATPRQLCAYA
jgi:hypothetical protein